MKRNDYIREVLPFLQGLDENSTDKAMGIIADYLVKAGEENEEAALEALGSPQVLGSKIKQMGADFEITPFDKQTGLGGDVKFNKPVKAEAPVKQAPVMKKDVKKMAIILGLLVITSPIWVCVTAVFIILGLAFALIVAALLLIMTLGGVVSTVLGVTKLFSVAPVGLVLTGAGLLLLGIAGIAFFPLLRSSIRLVNEITEDIIEFVRKIFRLANSAEVEA
ncbi:MAG: hypothetical protein IJC65_08580 [Oscillospiraceae bacterium]|nr:hypothetical protein [Oscillospiraceae bacterium]